ncbi:hypothetical protein NDU88_003204 [Pleurodeles waltl]|uniref:Uncharacterized protein n=1 Tax=Pleurodeles waltl TaxID=8319 RepID=A0AAV7SG69_PLEWA|nr:hypothetical protein NDU88_003204 [Pleurodeles waltl]
MLCASAARHSEMKLKFLGRPGQDGGVSGHVRLRSAARASENSLATQEIDGPGCLEAETGAEELRMPRGGRGRPRQRETVSVAHGGLSRGPGAEWSAGRPGG